MKEQIYCLYWALLQNKACDLSMTLITMVFFHCSKILKFQDLITHMTMIMLYKANNHCLEGRVQAFFEPTAAIQKHDTRQCKLLC